MKRIIALILAAIIALSLCACAADDKNTQNDGNTADTNQSSTDSSNSSANPVIKEPDYAFSPYGTWVWVGNDKFTVTLNEDGTAVYSDNSDNSYINLYPRLQELYLSTSNTFTYDEGAKKLKINLSLDDRTHEDTLTVAFGNGYYILDGTEFDYSFVKAEDYNEAHQNFMNAPIYSRLSDATPMQPGQTVDLFPDNEVKMTLNKVELDSNYNLKVFCTFSAKTGVSSFDWINWTLKFKGEGGERGNSLYFFDLNDQEQERIGDGQTIEGYFVIENVKSEKSMTWFGEIQAFVYIGGMYSGIGCYIFVPKQPNVG